MGYTPDRRQSADHTFETRPNGWSSPGGHMTSPTRRMQSPRSYLPGPSGQTSSPRRRMPSPTGNMMRHMGHYRGPADSSPSPRSNPCDFTRRHQDSAHAFAWEDDQLHTARVAAKKCLGASPSPERESPTGSDLPAQKRPHGPASHLLNFCRPANISPDTSRPMASAALRLSPAHLAGGVLQQGSYCPVRDPQQPFQLAANGSIAEQVEQQLPSPIARRKLHLNNADKTSQVTAPTNSSNIDSDSTAALGQTDLKDCLTLAELHTVVSDASNMPLTHMQDRADAAATKIQRQTQGGKSLLKKVLRKSLAKHDGDCTSLSGSDASCDSSQDVIRPCSNSASDAQMLPAKAADTQPPQHLDHGGRADVKKSRRAKRPQHADLSKQALLADVQTRLQDDRAKHKSKRHRCSLGERSCHNRLVMHFVSLTFECLHV